MLRHMHRWTVVPGALAALVLGILVSAAWAQGADNHERSSNKVIKFKDARLKIELNATDGDAGIQVFVDSEPWESISIFDPKGEKVFESITRGRFARQGGTELFLESAEPDFSELPLEDFLKRFPPGKYKFRGEGLEGERYVGTATLTHNLAAGPELVYPVDLQGLDPNNVTVMWNPVGPANGSPIIAYEVLVVQIGSPFPAIPKIALDVMMPASATSLAVPPGFLRPGTEYEWEVLAIEKSGNQTLSSSFFSTAGP